MPHEHDKAQDTDADHKHRKPDHDAEPRRATQRRVADVGHDKSKPAEKPESLEDIHDAADQAAYEGIHTNIDLLAKRMHDASQTVRDIIAWEGDEGGTDKKVEMIKAEYKSILGQVIRLRFAAATVKLSPARSVYRDLAILKGGYLTFQMAMSSAHSFAGDNVLGEQFRPDFTMKPELQMLTDHFAIDFKEMTYNVRDERLGDTEDMENEAIHASVGSIFASSKALKAAHAAGNNEFVDQNVGKLMAAVKETHTFLENLPPARLRSTKTLEKALAEIDSALTTVAGRTAIGKRLDNSGFTYSVNYLRSRVKKHK